MKRTGPYFLAIALALLGTPSLQSAPREQSLDRAKTALIEILDVGQGDAILIRSPEGKTALIDAGPSADVVSLLKKRGVRSIDLVAVSHHHADHYGGMLAVIEEFRPPVYLATNSAHTTPMYLKLIREVKERGMTALAPTDTPRKIELGSVVLTVLPQPSEDHKDENDNSIGIRVGVGAFSMLLTGDSEKPELDTWERTIPALVRDCTVLKLAHHGSRNGIDPAWLAIVRPSLAVVSVGRDNDFGHPHQTTLNLLRKREIPLLRTDRDGTIAVATDGRAWSVAMIEDVNREPTLARKARGRTTKGSRPHPRAERQTPEYVIDVNSADTLELEALPGVGKVLAARITEGRPYMTVEDLLRVKDIGPKRLEEIRPYVRVQ